VAHDPDLTYDRWHAIYTRPRDLPEPKRWARRLIEDPEAERPRHIAASVHTQIREEIREIERTLACMESGEHRWWYDGDRLTCITCDGRATPGELEAWQTTDAYQHVLAEVEERARRRERRAGWAQSREDLTELSIGIGVLAAWILPIAGLIALAF
jgi:hypothetical protein